MPLSPGTRLGPYEIVAPLGAGGMGEVYRARDTRLGRDVAVKVLPQHLSSNTELRARFEREAKAVSALNHPNICTLFDVGRAPGESGSAETDFLVMELVEGESLAARLEKGALPVADVLRIGSQVADALDRAHRAGVIHRDLKPGNVMLTKSGAKLMDFGLARATGLAGRAGSVTSPMTQSPTLAAPLTAEGTIVGTFQYMAPEQLEGREADARSDLWALGCVLYEMATGRRAFDGTTQASLISAIMRDAPRAMADLAPLTPPGLERVVTALLAKDPDDRVQTAHDVKLQLQWAGAPVSGASSQVAAPAASGVKGAPGRGTMLAWSAAGVALALAAVAWLQPFGRGSGTDRGRARFLIGEPTGARFAGEANSFAISPDGRTLAFSAIDSNGTSHLWLRPLDGLEAKPLPGSDRATMPFWSPDSRALGFFADGKLKRIGVEGGVTDVLADAPDPRGGTWGSQGVIVFAPVTTGALYQVPADGGEATELFRPDSTRGEVGLRFPEFLPDGRNITFISLPQGEGGYDVHVGRVGSGERRFLMRADAAPVYARPGWLLSLSKDRLVAQGIDTRSLKLVGKPAPLGQAPILTGADGSRAVSASRNGIMVYSAARQANTQLAWLDRSGHVEKLFSLPSGRWEEVSLSPDGSRALVFRRTSSSSRELWLVDVSSQQASRLPIDAFGSFWGVWSPDGRRFVFGANPKGPSELYLMDVDGTKPEVLYSSPALFKNPIGWSPDGKSFLFEMPGRGTGWDVWMIAVDGDRKPVPVIQTPSNEKGGWVSPDGRWLAYSSDESGTIAMYVRPFGRPGARTPLPGTGVGSAGYVNGCWWSADGRELLMLASDGQVRAIEVFPGETFRAGRVRNLFHLPGEVFRIAATSDHRRLLASVQVEASPPPALVVDMDWTEALKTH